LDEIYGDAELFERVRHGLGGTYRLEIAPCHIMGVGQSSSPLLE